MQPLAWWPKVQWGGPQQELAETWLECCGTPYCLVRNAFGTDGLVLSLVEFHLTSLFAILTIIRE